MMNEYSLAKLEYIKYKFSNHESDDRKKDENENKESIHYLFVSFV